MHFFLYEFVARIVAIYLLVDVYRKLRDGLAERKITYYNSSLLNWSTYVAHRDTAPIVYWIQIGIRITMLVSCLGVAVFGWWQPNP